MKKRSSTLSFRSHAVARARLAFAAAFFLAVVGLTLAPDAYSADSPFNADQVLDQYCVRCHNPDDLAGELALDEADPRDPMANHALWENVIKKLKHRQMPPLGKRRPDDSTYDAMIASLESSIDAAVALNPNPGRTDTFRRLTRTEYQNAIRDLLALEIDAAALLPDDDVSYGFDNITVGGLSPTLLERYLAAAKHIARVALGRPLSTPKGEIITVPVERTQEDHIDGLPFGTRGGANIRYTFPVDGEYDIQIRLMRNRDEQVEGLRESHEIELMLDGALVERFEIAPPSDELTQFDVDRHLVARVQVEAGPRDLAAGFAVKSAALIETERQPNLAHFSFDRSPRVLPAIYSLSVMGPYNASGPGDTPSRERIFTCAPGESADEDQCATDIISTLMKRAYRRPITEQDLEAPLRFYAAAKVEGGFDKGIEMALRAVLTSPHFLFRMETEPLEHPGATPYEIADIELASRLSFFLWSSLPDDELRERAANGELSQPDAINEQIKRMLADPRSEALVTSFASQWLYLRNLASTSPSTRLFMDFDDNLRQSMRRETELFLDSILREDRSVLDMLRADYTFVNERLAKHYGIPNIYGTRMRRIELGGDTQRGGLLTQASVLTVTSYANRTSPILRGKWILANILGNPPDPPPPNVPSLKERSSTGEQRTLREQISAHREDPACAGCHNLMDPLGFALENYDAIGRWRTKDGDFPVDATGSLLDGVQFDGAVELQQAILRRPEIFVQTLTEKLMTYALGRGLEHYDAPAVRKIVREAAQQDFRFSAIITGIINSAPFQMRSTQ